jgi:hypothetical protein
MPDTNYSGYYQHYKGGYYQRQLCGNSWTVLDTTSGKELAIYSAVNEDEYKHAAFARPVEEFEGTVEVDGKTVPRFRLIGADEKVRVVWYTYMCPMCGDQALPGKFSSKQILLDSREALTLDEFSCYSCRMDFEESVGEGWREAQSFSRNIRENSISVVPPLVARWRKDIETVARVAPTDE